jgi:hypothetical protein
MSIETRGNFNTLVLTGSAVPINEVANHIVDRKGLDWICNRYPISVDEVFECIDTIADLGGHYDQGITLINRGDDTEISLETVSVTDTVYFALISYGHQQAPDWLDMDKIYNRGLVKVIEEIYTDIKHDRDYYESSELHMCVQFAIFEELGNIDPETVLKNLDWDNE